MTRLLLVGLMLSLAGCATMQDVVDGKDKGTVKAYALPQRQAYDAAVLILRGYVSFSSVDQDRERGMIIASFNNSLGFFGVWVEPVSATESKVTALLRTRTPFPSVTENGFHEDLATMVRR